MTDSKHGHPAELAEEGNTIYGGFADIARRLNQLHPERGKPISRQLVQRWYKCRASNGMPARKDVEVKAGKTKPLFDVQAVERWHTGQLRDRENRIRQRGGNPPIDTIPLFMIDDQGSPIEMAYRASA